MVWKNKVKKSLLSYYPSEQIDTALKNYIPTQCQNIAPDLRKTDIHSQTFVAKQPLISFFLEKDWDNNRSIMKPSFYMILGESGMGKTTFMLNLYYGFLSKFRNSPWRIKILPLALPNVLDDLQKLSLEEKKHTILLLDAFDEDSKALKNHKERLAEIINTVKDFPEIIITCRTQFFPSREEEPAGEQGSIVFQHENKEYMLRKLYISPFDVQDVKNYLRKNYSFFSRKKRRKSEDMMSRFPTLLIRPMLLKYLDDLINTNKNYKYNFEVYDTIVERWIKREVFNSQIQNTDKHFEQLKQFSIKIAVNMFEHRNRRKGFFIGRTRFEHFREKFHLDLEENILRSRSLLSRNAEGQYRFSHQAIFEYFLALEAYENPEFAKKMEQEHFKDTQTFLEERYVYNAFKLKGMFKTAYDNTWQDLSSIQPVELLLVKEVQIEQEIEDFRYLRGFRNLQALYMGEKVLKGENLRDWLCFNNRTAEAERFYIRTSQENNLMLAG